MLEAFYVTRDFVLTISGQPIPILRLSICISTEILVFGLFEAKLDPPIPHVFLGQKLGVSFDPLIDQFLVITTQHVPTHRTGANAHGLQNLLMSDHIHKFLFNLVQPDHRGDHRMFLEVNSQF